MANYTITDVALRAGVSIKTVSRVINHEPNVKAETRERVTGAVAALGYRPNVSARSLAGSRAYLLGLAVDNPSIDYISALQMGAVRRCRAAGLHLIVEPLESAQTPPAAALAALVGAVRVDGLILTPPVCDDLDALAVLEAAGVAYVRLSPDREPDRGPRVVIDDARAAHDMTRALLDLGHRRIGFVRGHPEHGASHKRYEGFARALAAAGLPEEPELSPQGWFSFRSGLECGEELLSLTAPPSAIFACNDDMALGVLAAANRRGLQSPADLSVAGFDDTAMSRAVWPQLSTVRQPVEEMAAAAADILITGAGARGAEAAPVRRLLDFEVMLRGTTGPAPVQ